MSTGNISYSCLDENLSHQSITDEYWNTKNIDPALRSTGIATGLVMLIFFLVGVPSNILIIASILLQKMYRQPTMILLLSLAVADLLICLFVMPLIIIAGITGEFVFGDNDYVRCKVCQTGITAVALLDFSLHILAFLSFDRWIFIKFPLHYNLTVTIKKYILSIGLLSIFCIFISILPLIGIGDIYYDHLTFTCTPKFEDKTHITQNIHYMLLIIGEAILPFMVLIITNTWVVCIAQKQIREIYKVQKSIGDAQKLEYNQSIKNRLQQEKYRKQLQLMRVFGAILIAHIITWIPLIVRVIEAYFKGSDDFSPWSNFFLIISVVSHPVLHPLIEASIIPEIRKHLKVCRLCKCSSVQKRNICF